MSKLVLDSRGNAIPAIYQGVTQVVAAGASAAQSAPFQSSTTVVRLIANQNVWVSIGPGTQTPVSLGAGFMLYAGVVEYWGVQPGWQLGVIDSGTAGNLSITEGA